MEKQVKTYCEGVKMILHRDYAEWKESSSDRIEAVMQECCMESLYRTGYTEEAAAQKIFEENYRLNGKGRKQGVDDVTGMKFFQVAVKADRQYSRLPTELAKILFHRILWMLKKK